MKKLLIIGAAAVAASSALAATPDYIAHWDFSSDANGEIDVLGNYGLDNSDGVTIANGAAVFDGTAKCLCTKREIGLSGVRAYTIECFAKADADCSGMIMELSPNINNENGGFYILANEGVMVKGSSGRFNGEKFNSGNVCDGQWHHIALIVNPAGATAADKVQLYLDSVRQTTHWQNNTDSCLFTHRLYIGSRGGTSMPFKGMIDDVRITEGILSTDQFLQTRSENQGLDVRAYWKFDEGNALADSSGNANTLQGSQGVAFTNGCASFNGTASNVRTVNPFDLSAYKDVTVELFIRKPVEANNVGMIIEHAQNSGNTPGGFYLTINESLGGTWGLFRFADNYCLGISPAYAVNNGWHHVALVKDSSKAGSSACISLYVDGVRMNEYACESTASGDMLLNDYLYFGSRANNTAFLNADIDDVRITANVLVPGQFLRTRTGPIDDVIAYWPFENAANMLEDASGNGNVLTGSGVTVNDGAAVFGGSQSGFATLAPLPLYTYESVTVEWFMKSSMSGVGMVLETSADYIDHVGAFYVAANEYAGYNMLTDVNVLSGWSAMDGNWHHYALVYDRNETTADIVRLYCDGIQVTTHHRSETGGSKLWSDKLFIGARNGSKYRLYGELDDIKITGRALSPAEFMKKRSKPPSGMIISIR